MKTVLLMALIVLVVPLAARPQDEFRARQADEVRTIIQGFAPKTRSSVLTRGLIASRGKIVRWRAGSFDLKFSGRVITIAYDNVLELEGGGKSVSFVPDRAARNHGSWQDAGQIYPGTKILILNTDGTSAKGFSNTVTETHLIMVDRNGRERVDVPRENIQAVWGLIGGYGGVKAGASKGAEGMTNDRDVLLDGIFVGIGALVGMAKSDGRPILIYSR